MILPFERGAEGVTILEGDDAIWWAIVTITTVGYGDYVPVTFPSRVLAVLLMMFDTGICAVLTSFVASKVAPPQVPSIDQKRIIRTIQEENTALRQEMAELRKLLMMQPGEDANHRRDGDN